MSDAIKEENVSDKETTAIDSPNHIQIKEVCGREVAIQANAAEIEGNSGQVLSRKRFVPLKFSDYCVFANNVKEEDEEEEDASFTLKEVVSKPTVRKSANVPKRPRGRPKRIIETLNADGVDPLASVRNTQITKVANGYKCGICNRVFTLRGNVKSHLITHTDYKPFKCDFKDCGKEMRTKECMRRHKLSHLGIKTYECFECGKKFSCNLSLTEHMTLHTGEKPLSCGICGKKFRQIAVLKRHLTTHSNEKPFACSICCKTFALTAYLRSHMKSHTGERPYSCPQCSKSFAHHSDLNRHKIIHSGQKPYKCSICSMRYNDPSSRRRHEREHENKPQVVCHLCQQQFTRAGQLRVHLLKEHGTNNNKGAGNNLPFPMKIVKETTGWDPPADGGDIGNVLIDFDPNLIADVKTDSTNSSITPDTGQPGDSMMETVQIFLDASATDQFGVSKETASIPSDASLPSVQPSVQTMVLDVHGNINNLTTSLPVSNVYKVIQADHGRQVLELQVDNNSDGVENFTPNTQTQTQMNIDLSDIKIANGLVTFIQGCDMMTVIDRPQEIGHQNSIVIEQPQDIENQNIIGMEQPQKIGYQNSIVIKTPKVENEDNMIKDNSHITADSNQDCIPKTENFVNKDVAELDSGQANAVILDGNGKEPEYDGSNSITVFEMAENHSTSAKIIVNSDSESQDIQQYNLSNQSDLSTSQLPNVNNLANENPLNEIAHLSSSAISSIFIDNPDLNSQEYFNWLSNFSEECKYFNIPLSKEVFKRISHVNKTLADFLAMPAGVISDKNNFKILMGITQDLSQIISQHLALVYSHLKE